MDISNARWELSKDEEYAISWFEENGFSGKLEKQYLSKTIFLVERDGVKNKFELPKGVVSDISGFMQQYLETWDLLIRIENAKSK